MPLVVFCFVLLFSSYAIADTGDEVFRSVLELILDFLGDKLDEAIPPVEPVEAPVEILKV